MLVADSDIDVRRLSSVRPSVVRPVVASRKLSKIDPWNAIPKLAPLIPLPLSDLSRHPRPEDILVSNKNMFNY